MREPRPSWRDSLRAYGDRRLWIVFGLGFASGFPWVLIGSAMSAWLKEAGLTRTAIGFFGSVFTVYAVNFAWAPLLDRVRLPILHRLGRRRSWILFTQMLLFVLVLGIGATDPSTGVLWTSVLALGIALASATQDVAIDAYRIEILSEQESRLIPVGAAMATAGWWTGYSLPGALALILSDHPAMSWSRVYLVLSGIVLLLIAFVLRIREPALVDAPPREGPESRLVPRLSRVVHWLETTVVAPFRDFLVRNGAGVALAILSFVFLFKIGEAFLGRMSIVFYKEVGFSNTQIGMVSKLVGWWVTILFSVVGSLLNMRFGLVRGLFISGIAMASTNLMFSWMALRGPDPNLFAAAVVIDNFTSAFATVTFVSFISYLTSRAYTATQYALLASIGNFGRTSVASFSGAMVDALGGNWALFFVLTAVMVTPGLLLLSWLGRRLVGERAVGHVGRR